ncbi:ribonuclease P protein component [Williamsia sp. CHRR-6]|uniref:ribonuclease P protein component n=1 Tax=Williamsia sp. CHRR-6 TaxID=2835871 RepID=UPI001BDAD911|nr:ribonuclease P protein component [Williamsia sp. CHRR-6]MBT0567741.1 ribonuclease P protein component [Williamsia sp. CHRR-6]
MLTPSRRITSGSDFSRTLKLGARARRGAVVAHSVHIPSVWPDPAGIRRDLTTPSGLRCGLIVSKAVGNAVTRHRVARCLRVAADTVFDELEQRARTQLLVVVRALPEAADCSSTELTADLRAALRRTGAYE